MRQEITESDVLLNCEGTNRNRNRNRNGNRNRNRNHQGIRDIIILDKW